MQFDHARISIRERSWPEILDLALHVLRAGGMRMALVALVGIVPLAAMNCIFIEWFYGGGLYEHSLAGMGFFSALIVMIEAPLGTALLTLYLGQALFTAVPDLTRLRRDFIACLPQLLLWQCVIRTFMILPFVTWIIPYVIWPYLSEIILLERNPLVAGPGQVSTRMRNSNLHRVNSSDFLLRGILTLFLAPLLVVSLWVAQSSLLSALLGYEPRWAGQVVAMQAVLWLVAVYFTVARFLCYLDQRIRSEGWEVEISLRVQRERLVRQSA